MVKKTKGKHRLDKFYHLAKEQGYRSRAAFKLIQLNRKYDFLSGARTLVDLCAAPGGWCQVAVKNMPVGSLVIGVDLLPIKAIRGVKTLIGDITTQQCRQMIRKETGGSLIDVVLCDGAPNVGGAWSSEAYTQSELVLEAARMASDILAPNGTFVTKVFRSKDYSALIFALKQLFKKVEATKPAASRNASAEIFVVCLGYKAPSKIDPRIFDAKYIFCDFQEQPKIEGPDALLRAKEKQRRFREGYEDGISTTHKEISALQFVEEDSPVEKLGVYTTIRFAKTSDDDEPVQAFLKSHPRTTPEIIMLCSDLQVLGRSEFKQLLKWRLGVKKDLEKFMKENGYASESAEDESESEDDKVEENEEDTLLKEMEDIKTKMEKESKKEKKKRRKQKMDARVRSAQLAQAEGIGDEALDGPESLFSLRGVNVHKNKNVAETEAPDSESEEEVEQSDDASSSDSDLDEQRRRYDDMMDSYLEQSYQDWKVRQRMTKGGALKKKRKRLGMDGELEDSDDEPEDNAHMSNDHASDDDNEGDVVDSESSDEEDLLVDFEPKDKKITAADQWFSQDVFDGEESEEEVHNEDDNDESDEDELRDHHDAHEKHDMDIEEDKSSSEEEGATDMAARPTSNGHIHDFEVVPLSDEESDSAAEEFDALDDDAKAEMLALAKKFIRKKSKGEIIEAAYNRYAFHDTGLPKWFVEDEQKFMRPPSSITGSEFMEAKQQLQSIDARPIKKIAEAKARKRKRLASRLTQARQKAEAIANQEDVPMGSKMREIEKIYKQARSGSNKKRKPSRSDQYKRKGPPLDARLRSDRRGTDAAARRAKKGKRRRR